MSFHYDARGTMSHRTVSVSSSTAKVSISSDKEYMTISNLGSTICYIGGNGVDETTGYPIVPRGGYDFGKCKKHEFNFWVMCEGAGTTTLGVYEW